MRKLVTVRRILNILPIKEADMIEEVVVDGWSVVAQKGIHSVGDAVVYFEIDSFLPESDKRFESFMKFGTQTFEGILGHRVKTKRLRGVYSQGIIIPLNEFPEIGVAVHDTDYSELLGVVKYERPEVNGYNGDAKGNFPWFLRKSDQERIQNVYNKLSESQYAEELFVGTLKMDGSSVTVYRLSDDTETTLRYIDAEKEGQQLYGVCSRNQELKLDFDIPLADQGKFVQGVINSDLINKCKQLTEIYGGSYAIQGELVGAGIQGGFEKFDQYQVFAYNIFDINAQDFVSYNMFEEMAESVGLQTVPVIYEATDVLRKPLSEILEMADGAGLRASYREGIVWKQVLGGNLQFKAISNKYLSKEK
jgi:RNA ligase (TIGR02306 family)